MVPEYSAIIADTASAHLAVAPTLAIVPDNSVERDEASEKLQLQNLSKRLARAVDALATGDESAADDLAHLLRMLVARGKGDDAIRRAVRRWRLSEPQIRASAPAVARKDVWWAFANIPTTDSEAECVGFDEWVTRKCLVVRGLQRSTYDWG